MNKHATRNRPSNRRRDAVPLAWLMALAVTYLFSTMPFCNPHVGYVPPLSIHDRAPHPASPAIHPAKWRMDTDDSLVWATIEEPPSFLLAVPGALAAPPLPILLVVAAFFFKRRERAPPSRTSLSFRLRAPPLRSIPA